MSSRRHLPRVNWRSKHTQCGGPRDPFPQDNVVYDWSCDALLVSEPHWHLTNGAWSGGGPFQSWHATVMHSGEVVHPRWTENGSERGPRTIRGVSPVRERVFPPPANLAWPQFWSESGALQTHFPTAFARTRPGRPVADLGVFLWELRDLPQVPGRSYFRTIPKGTPFGSYLSVLRDQAWRFASLSSSAWKVAKAARWLGHSAGSEFLNLRFGWQPFLGDLRKLYELQRSIDRRLATLVRNNGRWRRRTATLADESTLQYDVFDVPYLYWGVLGGGPDHYLRTAHTFRQVTTRTTTKRWFVGSYRYWVPDIGSSEWTRRAVAHLYGVTPTPKLIWQAMPWSWLADWFSNMGDIVSNLSVNSVGYPVLRWSYLMETRTTTVTAVAHCDHQGYGSPGDANYWPEAKGQRFASEYREVRKLRVPGGNPFGFGLPSFSWTGLSTGQRATLAALGVSRR